MCEDFIQLSADSVDGEHLCCAIADKKHEAGVAVKRGWLKDRIAEGHVFKKLDARGKVFIEYAPLERAWVPVEGDNFLYIYCLWVSGSFKGRGYARSLVDYCIADARAGGRSGICMLSLKKKKPFLQDRGFHTADTVGEYELLLLAFDGHKPRFGQYAKEMKTDSQELTIYYSMQCPYIPHCIEEMRNFCSAHAIPLRLIAVDSLEKAKKLPGVFNNWALFYGGVYRTAQLLNAASLQKMLSVWEDNP